MGGEGEEGRAGGGDGEGARDGPVGMRYVVEWYLADVPVGEALVEQHEEEQQEEEQQVEEQQVEEQQVEERRPVQQAASAST
jgi:hypothetical protein